MKKTVLVILSIAVSAFIFAQNDGGISEKTLKAIKEKAATYPETKALQNAVSNNDIHKLTLNRENLSGFDYHFSHRVENKGISDQQRSGRCWLFTGLNVLRARVIENFNLPAFEFSYNYSFFYDQLEKSNMFLEGIIATADLPMDDKKVEWLIRYPIGDGGQWTTFANIVQKYGLVPAEVMPESHNSNNTALMRSMLRKKLKEYSLKLRKMHASGKEIADLRKAKTLMLSEIYHILELCLGTPPETFTWRYKDEKGMLNEPKEYTPKSFYDAFVNVDLNDYVMFMNDPTRPYNKLYEVEYDRSVFEGNNWKFINLDIPQLMEFAKLSIMNNEAMYFSCDVGKQINKDNGLLDPDNYNYDALFGMEFGMNKEERIMTYESGSTHGMSLCAVDINKDNQPEKWLLENSWGSSAGYKGHLVMTNEWFNEYMFRIVINKKYVSEEVLKILKTKAVLLPPWDPMFTPDL